ncbi:hypothetical protein BC936DRAFT_139334 [Jimgerdemannia flammicorona]|uniref:Uncharacterized protein n=1 Tax=Jimgerdemannia flammicorona TaxID=994334 RepID=A0A433BA37_9FUNG|nr:hypothetical protein BC936DRAFT_139334 [Jimgerdemannia flammicorona]
MDILLLSVPARSYILDLTPTSKIINEFSSDEWTKLLTNKCVKASRYHHEIETITNKLFGPVGVRLTLLILTVQIYEEVNIDPNAGSTTVERVELSSRSLTQRRILLQQGSMGEDTMVGWTCCRTIVSYSCLPSYVTYMMTHKSTYHPLEIAYSLDAFEAVKSPLDSECNETEWKGDYVVPLLQGALKLDGMCRVR